MVYVFINEKTGKRERHIQCKGCLDWIPASEYGSHTCPKASKGIWNLG